MALVESISMAVITEKKIVYSQHEFNAKVKVMDKEKKQEVEITVTRHGERLSFQALGPQTLIGYDGKDRFHVVAFHFDKDKIKEFAESTQKFFMDRLGR